MMKLSTTLEVSPTFPSDCAAAARQGFDAAFVIPSATLGVADLGTVHRQMTDAGLPPCGVRSHLSWAGAGDVQFPAQLKRTIDVAAELSCPLLGVIVADRSAGNTASSVIAPFRDVLLPLGEYARAQGIRLLVGNRGLLDSARRLWALLDQLPRESFGCWWDLNPGAAGGESAAVFVQMLNLRLGCVELDPLDDPSAAKSAVHRLAGIGFSGMLNVTTSPPRLASAVELLRRWTAKTPVAAAGAQSKTPAIPAGVYSVKPSS